MSLSKQQKSQIFQALTKQHGFVKSRLAEDLYYSPANGALLYWDGNTMELNFGLCEADATGSFIMR